MITETNGDFDSEGCITLRASSERPNCDTEKYASVEGLDTNDLTSSKQSSLRLNESAPFNVAASIEELHVNASTGPSSRIPCIGGSIQGIKRVKKTRDQLSKMDGTTCDKKNEDHVAGKIAIIGALLHAARS
jgi:hypothetical protein